MAYEDWSKIDDDEDDELQDGSVSSMKPLLRCDP